METKADCRKDIDVALDELEQLADEVRVKLSPDVITATVAALHHTVRPPPV